MLPVQVLYTALSLLRQAVADREGSRHALNRTIEHLAFSSEDDKA
jgi:hypothetical protein